MKKKRKRGRWIALIIVIIVIILAVILILRNRRSGANEEESSSSGFGLSSVTTTTETEAAYIGDIKISTEGSGSIEASEEVSISADYPLKVETVKVDLGDTVEEGDVIATLDPDSIQDQIDLVEQNLSDTDSSISSLDDSGSSSLSAPVSGRVKRIYAKEGDLLSDVTDQYGGVMEISADKKLKVEFESDESLKLGSDVTVSFLSYEEEGTVSDKDGNTYTVLFDDGQNYLVDTEAEITDEDDKLLGKGEIESNHPYLVEASYGIVDDISVDVGDSVSAGDTLLTRTDVTYNATYLDLLSDREEITDDLTTLRELKQDPALTAPSSGIISSLMLVDGEYMMEDTTIYSLISTDSFCLKAEIDELDIDKINVGQTATVVFDAFEDEEYEGTIEKISGLGTNSGGVTNYTVTIDIPGADKLKTAMSATATIVTDEKDNVLLIPVDAVHSDNGKRYVTVRKGDEDTETEVTLGLVNNTVAEVTDGLSEGDIVVITTESSVLDNLMSGMRDNMLEGGSTTDD